MNVLFLSLSAITTLQTPGIYQDLLRKFVNEGHSVFVVSAAERRTGEQTHLIEEENCRILRVRCGNITKTNMIEKGISTVTLGFSFSQAVKQYLKGITFDLILYPTPPVTILPAVRRIQKLSGGKTYLLLKDIFPQNAVDLGIMRKNGLLYQYFRHIEQGLYRASGRIGCMSPANVRFLLEHNPEIPPASIELFPNCQEIRETSIEPEVRQHIRQKYGIADEDTVFVLGGNLSSGHDFPFALQSFLQLEQQGAKVHLLFVGAGTEVNKISAFIKENGCRRISYVSSLPIDAYETLVCACDVGLILLDKRFTIPNFPSRLLSYMQAKKPVFCITDAATDVGTIAEENGFGWQCLDGDQNGFSACMDKILNCNLAAMGEKAFSYLKQEYDVAKHIQKLLDYCSE